MHHVLTNESLHLQRIKVLLIVDHITQRLLIILNLSKLDEKHVVELVEVLAHIIDRDAPAKLEENGFNAAIEFALELSDLCIILLVGLGVLVEPVLAVLDRLVHAYFKIFMALLAPLHLCFGLSDLLPHLCLGAKHHILDLLKVLLVLVKLLLEGHSCLDFLVKVNLSLIYLFLASLKLLIVVRVYRLEFLLESLNFLVEVGDLEDLLLQFLNHLLLCLCPLVRQLCCRTDLSCTVFVLVVELRVVLSQLPECLA